MVPRTRLLLIGPLALACKAESLGVDVPRGGPDAISQEDLQRDAWMFAEGDVAARFEERLQQMHTLPAFGASYRLGEDVVCGLKDGRSGKAVVIMATGEGSDVPLARASVVSLAKAWDVPQAPPHSVVFCSLFSATGRAAYQASPALPLDATLAWYEVGAMGGGALQADATDPEGNPPVVRLSAVASGSGAPDYRVVAARVRDAWVVVSRTGS